MDGEIHYAAICTRGRIENGRATLFTMPKGATRVGERGAMGGTKRGQAPRARAALSYEVMGSSVWVVAQSPRSDRGLSLRSPAQLLQVPCVTLRGTGDSRERLGVGESNLALVKPHKAGTLPFAKATVHAFLRGTGHRRELALRRANFRTGAVVQAQESLRQPSIEVGKGELGNLFVGATKAAAQGLEELQTDVGAPLKKRADLTTLESEELAGCESNGVRCAPSVRQQGDFPKDLAG